MILFRTINHEKILPQTQKKVESSYKNNSAIQPY